MEAVPIVRVLALAMPFVTLQILFAPAATALGRPRVQVYAAAAGAIVMPLAFFCRVRWGPVGMAWAWLAAFPLVTALYRRDRDADHRRRRAAAGARDRARG